MSKSTRSLQKYRTRKDILQAATRLVKAGGAPTMEEVAAEAMVSRATIYRYFTNVETLLFEASVDVSIPDPNDFFSGIDSQDPVERLDMAEAMMHEVIYENENIMRHLQAGATLAKSEGQGAPPRRQNRRVPLIAAALEPIREKLPKKDFDRLSAALALVFGPESMIVYRDVVPISPAKARAVKSWILKALVEASLD